MSPTQGKKLRMIRFVGIATIAAGVSACVPETKNWSPAEAPKVNKVDFIRLDHAVGFAGSSASLTANERNRLERFLASVQLRPSDQVLVGTPGAKAGSGVARLAGRREAAVSEFLRARNIRAGLMPASVSKMGETVPPWSGGVSIVVGRYVVTPPTCPNLQKKADGDPANRLASNFGCTTAANFALMLADPGDLIRNRQMSPGDGEYLSRGVRSYQEGAPPPPPVLVPLVKSGSEE